MRCELIPDIVRGLDHLIGLTGKEARRNRTGQPVDREDLIAVWPHQRAFDLPGLGVHQMDSASASAKIDSGRVLGEPRYDTGRTDSGSAGHQTQTASPSIERDHWN